ncbi:alpha-galactosidase [Heyndrickxia acidicola]|uniref:Alpha-galactosidase n=1 Tax=Heyndrickxia acidicola TaxID=209389 RepID=A0ABU6MJP5_9BACI|nr:alpha-galactosidase [Heyndrickxia acidicola]MED1204539.1 alpha-galactosidase [Heyndrickxia acidicola]
MAICFDAEQKTFHLQAKDTSYVIKILREGYLGHMYWGKKIKKYHESNPILFVNRGFSPNPDPNDRAFSLDTIPHEYPAYGNGDFRGPAYQIQLKNGSTITDLRYASHYLYKGKKKLDGLPSTYVESEAEADTLVIVLEDALIGLQAELSYTVYNHLDVITRTVQLRNNGNEYVKILRILSASIDFRDHEFDLLTLHGAHNNERNLSRRPLHSGVQAIESRRGASGPQQDPFFALLRKNTTEDLGEVFAFNFVYSGNFLAQIEVDSFQNSRASMGINPFDFTWLLEPGECFQAPEVVLVYSSSGLSGMSAAFHQLYRTRLCRGRHRDLLRPVLINNWEATYFNFDEKKIKKLAQESKKLGIELLVLDDGWFGKRDNDKSSLGDWVVDTHKLPNGLGPLGNYIESLGMEFGLWFEPEMVSEDSQLYSEHPDWCLHVPERPRTTSRSQLVLDLSRADVCEYIIDSISAILTSAPISYVKWDMNRHMTEIGSSLLSPDRQRETAHRYMLGLYQVLETLTARFPDILFEGCSSGGGRFDAGMLYYMPQTWASDNTDAISRLKIQYGTSLVYPPITIGAHVSAIPNKQMGRITPLDTRGYAAMSGNLGYELDVTKLTEEDRQEIKQQIALYKEIRHLIQFGSFYRILSPFERNSAAWNFISVSQDEAAVFYFRVLAMPAAPIQTLKLKGLHPDYLYQDIKTKKVYGGDELMYTGLTLPNMKEDFRSLFWIIKKVNG